jgi:hypothetical protein
MLFRIDLLLKLTTKNYTGFVPHFPFISKPLNQYHWSLSQGKMKRATKPNDSYAEVVTLLG